MDYKVTRFADFKSFLQANYGKYFLQVISDFIERNHDGNGFHSLNVLSLCKQRTENLQVKSLRCIDAPGSLVKIDVNVTVDIVVFGLGTKKYEVDRKSHWFTIHIQALLRDEKMTLLNKETYVEDYNPASFNRLTALDEFMVPYIYSSSLEEIADDFIEFYCSSVSNDGYIFPYQTVMDSLEMEVYEADLPETTMGRMYFRNDIATIYKQETNLEEAKYENHEIKPGTMLISKNNYFMCKSGTIILTIAHEIMHWYLHQKFFCILSLLDDNTTMMPCATEPSKYDEGMTGLQKALWFVEWQANALAIRVVMPQKIYCDVFKEVYYKELQKSLKKASKAQIMEATIQNVADLFKVSTYVAKQRAIQLGIDVAEGTFVYIDGKYHFPFYFTPNTLEKNQTFLIDRNGVENLKSNNPAFSELLNSGKFVYLGYVVCINDASYVKRAENFIKQRTGYEYELTDYAREHVDECCLIFNWESSSGIQDPDGFYGRCYLSKDVSAHSRIEHKYNQYFEFNQDTRKLAEEIAKYKAAFAAEDEVLDKLPRSFKSQLIYHMDRKKITVEELADQASLSEKTIKKYRAGTSTPDIDNIMAVFIGLNLPEVYCDRMLTACGLSLTDVDLKHKVYRILIREHSDGNIEQWNKILCEFGLDTIPNRRNQKIKE